MVHPDICNTRLHSQPPAVGEVGACVPYYLVSEVFEEGGKQTQVYTK